ncbi:DUF4405 domain-containing protein [Thiocapsa sp.]|uniref:DUF4405 domain-containing protein n=1 Tax=Thiocapsa sp. TaxID=2024551 RepID=UPI0035936879
MIKNAHSTRAFVAFLVTWSFVILTVTGIVLYVVPHGRVGNWTFWTLGGLGKDGWADVHILFGAIFIVTGALHLYFNWKPFKKYLAERVSGHLAVKRELVTSLVATLLLALGALFAVPPVSWLFDLNDWAKSAWSGAPGQEPPYARAEATPLPVLAQRLGLDPDTMRKALTEAGVRIDDPNSNLERLARAHNSTPAALFALIPKPATGSAQAGEPLDPAVIEDRLTGTGLGGKTLGGFAETNGLDAETVRTRLAASGLEAELTETLKAIAERYSTRPIEIAKVLLAPAYRLPSTP